MRGFWWDKRACRVGSGTPEWLTNRTGSPLSAAQPAAGIAYVGSSAEAITTSGLLLPSAALTKRSISPARAYGPAASTETARRPFGAGTLPTLITWAPLATPEPVGASALSASAVARGSSEPPESSTGARIGGAISTAEATAACQSLLGAIVTAVGWVPGATDGYTASATPAASAVGSLPGTRVVFLVATEGKPSP